MHKMLQWKWKPILIKRIDHSLWTLIDFNHNGQKRSPGFHISLKKIGILHFPIYAWIKQTKNISFLLRNISDSLAINSIHQIDLKSELNLTNSAEQHCLNLSRCLGLGFVLQIMQPFIRCHMSWNNCSKTYTYHSWNDTNNCKHCVNFYIWNI